jgi:hypothetical protein
MTYSLHVTTVFEETFTRNKKECRSKWLKTDSTRDIEKEGECIPKKSLVKHANVCVSVLGTQTFLFAKREMDNFTWHFEKRELGSAKSQEESRQRKCAMMISLWFLYLAVFMFVQVISALLHLLVSWLVEKCKVHKDHCIFLCVFSFESIHGATFECSSMVLLSFRVNYV